jgi:hypothetical protein
MPEVKPRKKRRKKIRYKEVTLKLTKKQERSLADYCTDRRTTPNKLIKKMIRKFLSYSRTGTEDTFVTPNQLDLFEEGHARKTGH